MMKEETFFLILKGIAAISTVPFFILIYMAIFHVERHDAFVTLATRNHRTNLLQDIPPPWYHPRRLWRLVFLLMAWVGGGYLVYGVALSLFAWMPEEWRVWQFDGICLSTLLALSFMTLSMFLLPLWWDWLVERSWQRREFEKNNKVKNPYV